MARLSIELPDDLVDSLKLPPGETLTRLRRELAIRLYEKGLLSFGKARELAGMNRWAFHDLLGDEGIARRYGVEELEQDLRSLADLS